jgi:isochorismate synthase
MEIILEKAKLQFESNLPFVLYKKPNETSILGIFQNNDNLFLVNDFTEKGFVFSSFDGTQTVLIPENQSEILDEEISDFKFNQITDKELYSNEIHRTSFENLIKKGIQAIEREEFKKVVLSRKETIELNRFDLFSTFQKLVQFYPATFAYCFYHPKVGLWLGASPELLLKSENKNFSTIALAGTQKTNDFQEVVWKKKEIIEQQFVTDYIVNKLETVAQKMEVSKPYSFKAGSLCHIKTDISGILTSDCSLQNVIRLLHPTPAVCGFPKDNSKKFILNNEQYDRTFYTGFLGELNFGNANESQNSDLFVNLRCMEIIDNQAHLFMGCGITKDSIPEKEWEESVNKSMTMKKIVDLESN